MDTETFDSLRARLGARYDQLTPHLQRVGRVALEDPNIFALETVAAIAARARVQPSTIVRFAKEFGYSGFSQMQRVFKLRLIEGQPLYRERVYAREHTGPKPLATEPETVLKEFVDASIGCLEGMRGAIRGRDMIRAVDLLASAEHIFVAGQRRSFPIASYLSYSLTRLEYRCSFLDFTGGMAAQQAATMTARDVLVAIAFAEYSRPVVDIVKDVHIRGMTVLAITDTGSSPLAKNAELAFLIDDGNAHRFRPIAAPIALVQTLMILLAIGSEARGLGAVRDQRSWRPS